MRVLFFLAFSLQTSILLAQSLDTSKIYTSDTALLSSFEKVDVKATIDQKVLRKIIVDSLQKAIENAASNGLKKGVYTVRVRFVVERDGSLSDIKVLNDPGYGLATAARNVVRALPKWSPAEKEGRKVRCYFTQPFTFVIQEQ